MGACVRRADIVSALIADVNQQTDDAERVIDRCDIKSMFAFDSNTRLRLLDVMVQTNLHT